MNFDSLLLLQKIQRINNNSGTIPAGAGRANKESQFLTLLVMKYVLPLSIILYLLLPIKSIIF